MFACFLCWTSEYNVWCPCETNLLRRRLILIVYGHEGEGITLSIHVTVEWAVTWTPQERKQCLMLKIIRLLQCGDRSQSTGQRIRNTCFTVSNSINRQEKSFVSCHGKQAYSNLPNCCRTLRFYQLHTRILVSLLETCCLYRCSVAYTIVGNPFSFLRFAQVWACSLFSQQPPTPPFSPDHKQIVLKFILLRQMQTEKSEKRTTEQFFLFVLLPYIDSLVKQDGNMTFF